ncbi:anti-sigma factor [Brevundimonas sp. AJA228-03]|uniref:anti-sigma factor n=1 Tax=Brevundimonas sp. AJA228-03 TaxID=2752515 RepID=UPI001AE0BD47|nr:anti-sigma factor [Brevundimonas sp. AJA228-03]QTN20673.1 anti-sigma factor [Brevundimonas sp. AJA228-03]
MTDTPIDPADQDRALAGELVLRVLSAEEEQAARARERSDPAFAAEVEAWNQHLATFADEITPVTPSSGVWPRVEAAIQPVANDNGRVAFWRTWAVASTALLAASVAGVAILLARPEPAPIAPSAPEGGVTRVATLSLTDGGAPAVALAYDTATGKLFIAPTTALSRGTGVPHLWLVKPEGGVQLVGAIDGSATSRRTLTALLADEAGQARAVAISLEAPGHTPGADAPDGPVVATGELQPL